MHKQIEDELNECFIPGSGIEFTGDVWRSLCKPCVYVASNPTQVLYVGMSANGLSRPFNPKHHKLSTHGRDAVESVKIYPCRSVHAARMAERLLIASLRPVWNSRLTVAYKYRHSIDRLIDELNV
jgi:hypothetical protein